LRAVRYVFFVPLFPLRLISSLSFAPVIFTSPPPKGSIGPPFMVPSSSKGFFVPFFPSTIFPPFLVRFKLTPHMRNVRGLGMLAFPGGFLPPPCVLRYPRPFFLCSQTLASPTENLETPPRFSPPALFAPPTSSAFVSGCLLGSWVLFSFHTGSQFFKAEFIAPQRTWGPSVSFSPPSALAFPPSVGSSIQLSTSSLEPVPRRL